MNPGRFYSSNVIVLLHINTHSVQVMQLNTVKPISVVVLLIVKSVCVCMHVVCVYACCLCQGYTVSCVCVIDHGKQTDYQHAALSDSCSIEILGDNRMGPVYGSRILAL